MAVVIPASTTPTSAEVYEASFVTWRRLKITDSAQLDPQVVQAAAYLTMVTGRYFSDFPPPTSFPGMDIAVTPELIPLFVEAHRMRVEQIISQQQPGYVDTVTDDAIASMNVGSYSESRRDPTRRGESKALNLWTGLNDLLWGLMTDERYDHWTALLTGTHAPAFEVQEVDWALIGKTSLWPTVLGSSWWE